MCDLGSSHKTEGVAISTSEDGRIEVHHRKILRLAVNTVDQWFSKCGSGPAAPAATKNLLEMLISGSRFQSTESEIRFNYAREI